MVARKDVKESLKVPVGLFKWLEEWGEAREVLQVALMAAEESRGVFLRSAIS